MKIVAEAKEKIMFKVEFSDFTEIGGIGNYSIRIHAKSISEAEDKALKLYPSSWDVKAISQELI